MVKVAVGMAVAIAVRVLYVFQYNRVLHVWLVILVYHLPLACCFSVGGGGGDKYGIAYRLPSPLEGCHLLKVFFRLPSEHPLEVGNKTFICF